MFENFEQKCPVCDFKINVTTVERSQELIAKNQTMLDEMSYEAGCVCKNCGSVLASKLKPKQTEDDRNENEDKKYVFDGYEIINKQFLQHNILKLQRGWNQLKKRQNELDKEVQEKANLIYRNKLAEHGTITPENGGNAGAVSKDTAELRKVHVLFHLKMDELGLPREGTEEKKVGNMFKKTGTCKYTLIERFNMLCSRYQQVMYNR